MWCPSLSESTRLASAAVLETAELGLALVSVIITVTVRVTFLVILEAAVKCLLSWGSAHT